MYDDDGNLISGEEEVTEEMYDNDAILISSGEEEVTEDMYDKDGILISGKEAHVFSRIRNSQKRKPTTLLNRKNKLTKKPAGATTKQPAATTNKKPATFVPAYYDDCEESEHTFDTDAGQVRIRTKRKRNDKLSTIKCKIDNQKEFQLVQIGDMAWPTEGRNDAELAYLSNLLMLMVALAIKDSQIVDKAQAYEVRDKLKQDMLVNGLDKLLHGDRIIDLGLHLGSDEGEDHLGSDEGEDLD